MAKVILASDVAAYFDVPVEVIIGDVSIAVAWNGICRTGCNTQDHVTYAECLKAAAIQIGNLK